MNPYSTLGVARNASADTIKRAYKQKAKEHHPDRGGDANTFAEISNAYDILKDPQKRAYFDHTGSAKPQAFNQQRGTPWSFEDIFGEMFKQQRQRPPEARISMAIDLADSIVGGKRIIGVNTHLGSSNVEIDIPKGVVHGESIRYGKAAPGGLDLIVNFRIKVDFWTLIVGGDIKILDVVGKKYELRIPPRTNPGSVMRLGKCGVFRDRHNPGDIFVKLKAIMPTKIPEEIIETIKKYKINI